MDENREIVEKAEKRKGRREMLFRLAAASLLSAAITAAFWVARNGLPVWGAPKPEDVVLVRVELLKSGHVTEVREPGNIETACRLVNLLNYQPFTPADVRSPAKVALTYTLKDGRELTARASWLTGWWNGEAHALKQPDLFVNVTEALFFSREARRENY